MEGFIELVRLDAAEIWDLRPGARISADRSLSPGCGRANHNTSMQAVYFEGQRVDPAAPGQIVTDCIESGAGSLLLDAPALPPEFFDLRTGILGAIVQRVAQYGIDLAAVVGETESRSESFQAFVREANSGSQVRFMGTRGEAISWLVARSQ